MLNRTAKDKHKSPINHCPTRFESEAQPPGHPSFALNRVLGTQESGSCANKSRSRRKEEEEAEGRLYLWLADGHGSVAFRTEQR
jgi:hypothetical protein